MRILHIIATADTRDGGPIEGINRIGDALRADGHQQEILTLDAPDADWVGASPETIHALGHRQVGGNGLLGRISRWARYSPAAVRWLRRHVSDYDGVVVNGLWNYSAVVAARVLPTAGVPYLVFPHGMLDPWFARRYPLKHAAKRVLWAINEGPLLRAASAVVFTCEQERKLARLTFRPWGMREAVVGFGTAAGPPQQPGMVAAFRARVPELGDRRYLLYLSRIHEKKGCDVLIGAFARLAGDFPDVDLVMAGPGDEALIAALKAQAAANGIGHRVHWAGMVAGDLKWGAYYGCEAHVLASHQENFGIVVAEAMTCGKPVVISNQVNIFDEIEAAGAGVIGDDTVDGFEPALRRFLSLSEAERKDMGERGRALFERRFEIGATERQLVRLLEDAGAGKEIPRASD